MGMDCKSTRPRVRFSCFLDYLVRRLSWAVTAVFFLLCGFFRKEIDVSFYFSALYIFSVLIHTLREIVEVGNTYPEWLEIGRHVKTHKNASLPLWVLGAIFTGEGVYQGRVGLASTAFLLFIAFDWIVAYCLRCDEEFFRSLIPPTVIEKATLSPLAEGGGVDVHAHGSADLWRLKEGDDLPLMLMSRSRNGNHETIRGEALVEFENESERSFLNIPFCPPFDDVPQLDFEQISGEDVSINISLLRVFGARLDIKKTLSATVLPEVEKEPIRIVFYSVFPPLMDKRCF